ncbi:MAG: hypothetical protein JWP57_4413 [Spirosoma sp.]|nr:hypothetical protein [Spirosoma sp.]
MSSTVAAPAYSRAVLAVTMPKRIKWLPVSDKGMPIPWCARPTPGQNKAVTAIKRRLCWICGEQMGSNVAMSLSPLGTINRATSEPPAHRDCAVFSAKAGLMSRQNPAVVAVWVTRGYGPFRTGNGGALLTFDDPEEVLWFKEGRPATREEVTEAIEAGLPAWRDMAEKEGPSSVDTLKQMVDRALTYLP